MNAAIDALLKEKYGPDGIYRSPGPFDEIFRPGLAKTFVDEVPRYTPEVIACTKDICSYIYNTYGRFPAHVDAFYVPGIWVQAHHLDLEYYDRLFEGGYSETQARHHERWHAQP
jgi:hypothetical protein